MGFGKLIIEASEIYGLDKRLIAAVIYTETKGDPWLVRYEQAFYDRYIAPKTLAQLPGKCPRRLLTSERTEMILRATSFGLMQIMGQVAREANYMGQALTYLLQPEENLLLGTKILANHIKKTGSIESGLLRYNGGGDPDYPKKVLTARDSKVIDFLLED